MRFTVVIPLYNKEKYIIKAINSVLNQTYDAFEIIIVDDGSTDSSLSKVQSIMHSKIQIIKQENAGVSAARNKGIESANFQYIAFLDADDEWHSDYLETISDLIDRYPEHGAYATAYEEVKRNNSFIPSIKNNNFKEGWEGIVDSYFKESIKSPLISSSSVVIPKEVFDKVGAFPVGITRGEDQHMWCKVALNYKIVFSNKALVKYFKEVEDSATQKPREYNKSFMSYVEDIFIEERKNGNNSIYFEEYVIRRLINKANFLISSKNNKEARALLYKYRKTKYSKKLMIKTFLRSYKLINYLYLKIR